MTTDVAMPVKDVANLKGVDVRHIIFILDRSGSMSGLRQEVIDGFNTYVDDLRKQPAGDQVGISYVRFDTEIELVWNDTLLANVPQMDEKLYEPRGLTALLDAVGMTVSAIQNDEKHSYLIITNTDGQENASREWTNEKLKALIEEREKLGNWTFAFFGTNIDVWGQAQHFTGYKGSTASYAGGQTVNSYSAQARVSNVMRARRTHSTKNFGETVSWSTAHPDATDDEIAEKLAEDGDDSKGGK